MGDNTTKVEAETRPADTHNAAKAPPLAEAPASQPSALLRPAPQSGEAPHPPEVASQPNAPSDKSSFQDFKAGYTDPLVGVEIEEVLVKTDNFIVYIDEDLTLHWHWTTEVDSNSAAPIFNRACELQAKSNFCDKPFAREI